MKVRRDEQRHAINAGRLYTLVPVGLRIVKLSARSHKVTLIKNKKKLISTKINTSMSK